MRHVRIGLHMIDVRVPGGVHDDIRPGFAYDSTNRGDLGEVQSVTIQRDDLRDSRQRALEAPSHLTRSTREEHFHLKISSRLISCERLSKKL
jgi:hypothetical protein